MLHPDIAVVEIGGPLGHGLVARNLIPRGTITWALGPDDLVLPPDSPRLQEPELKAELLAQMPPYQGGGSMIDRVSFERTTYALPPGRFEAGTPHIVGALGLAAAIDYVEGIGLPRIHSHETALVARTRAALAGLNSVRLLGPADSAGIVSFTIEGVHPHDIGTILDEERVAIRAGHHCAQPLMEMLGVEATARASFGVYNGPADVDALVRGIARVTRIFG